MAQDATPHLALPYLLPSQAQKHVTHNEALRRLDAIVHLAVADRDRAVPPAAPQEGDRHLVAEGASGDWAGHAGEVALREDGAWSFLAPRPGWSARVLAEGVTLTHDGGAWRDGAQDPLRAATLGVNAAADATNRLAVAAPSTLLSHDGAGHQVKVNKAAPADTASLLFQTGWSGRAEMGTAGSDRFAVKVSANGAAWSEALSADPATGRLSLPQGAEVGGPLTGAAVTQGPADATPGRLVRTQDGYVRATVVGPVSQSGGVPTGAVIERGSNANGDWVRLADGTQICTSPTFTADVTTAAGAMFRSALQAWTFPAAFASAGSIVVAPGSSNNPSTHFAPGRATSALQGEIGFFAPSAVTGRTGRLLAIGRWF